MPLEDLVKKTIPFAIGREKLQFLASQSLFSSFSIDLGSQLLLRTLTSLPAAGQKVLDLGCGYGVLGLSLKALDQTREIILTDRDSVAVEFSRANASHNNLEAKTMWTIGYDEIEDNNFDLIVSNIPAKAGEAVISSMLVDAKYFLKHGGMVAVVVIARLAPFIKSVLTGEENISLILEKGNKSYTVFHYEFKEVQNESYTSAFKRGIYFKGSQKFIQEDIRYFLTTAYGLGEFDELDFQTQLLITEFLRLSNWKIETALVSHVGQGHIPFLINKFYAPKELTLVDRDKLALQMARYNLENGEQTSKPAIKETEALSKENGVFDLLVLKLREEDGREVMANMVSVAVGKLSEKGKVFVTGSSTAITRLMSDVKTGSVEKREKLNGESVIIFKKKS